MGEGVIQLVRKYGGPTSMILVGVHGDERCGVEAIERVLPSLRIEKGEVFVGYGNPRAIERNARFTEANLNRMFKPDEYLSVAEKESYEYKRAQFLKKYLNQADALLDIHASFTPKSRTFLICEKNALEIAQHLPFDLVVSGFDAVEPGGTDYYMNTSGGIGMCAECGYLGDERSARVAEESLRSFLVARGHVRGATRTYQQSSIVMYNLYFTKTDTFVLARPFEDFEEVHMGEVIGTDGNEKISAPKESVILFARNRSKIGEEAFLLGEKLK